MKITIPILVLIFVALTHAQSGDKWTFPISQKTCPCWWDLEQKLTDPTTNAPYVCACCKPNALQCGYPEHQRCEKKKSGQRRGCNGVQAKGETLSEIGFPCNFDPTRRDCAWCTYDGVQCSETSPRGQQSCVRWDRNIKKQCYGTSTDCRNNKDLCDVNAECVDSGLTIKKSWTFWTCACKSGFRGNGITCVNADDKQTLKTPSPRAEVQAVITTEFIEVPEGNDVDAEVGAIEEDDLVDEMLEMLETGEECTGCNETIATCAA